MIDTETAAPTAPARPRVPRRRTAPYLELLKRIDAIDKHGKGLFMSNERLRQGLGPNDITWSPSQLRRLLSRGRVNGDLVVAGFTQKGIPIHLQKGKRYALKDLPIDPARSAAHLLRPELGEEYNRSWDFARAQELLGTPLPIEPAHVIVDGWPVARRTRVRYTPEIIKRAVAMAQTRNPQGFGQLRRPPEVLVDYWCRVLAYSRRRVRIEAMPEAQRTPKEIRALEPSEREAQALKELAELEALEKEAGSNPIAAMLLKAARADAQKRAADAAAPAPRPGAPTIEALPLVPVAPGEALRFFAACDAFLDGYCAAKAAETRERFYPGKLQNLRRLLGDFVLDGLTARELDRYVAARLAEGVVIETIRKELKALALVFDQARRHALCQLDARTLFPRLQDRTPRPDAPHLSREQFEALLAQLQPVRRDYVALTAYLMTRPGETLSLRIEDCKRSGETWEILVRGTKTRYAQAWLPLVGRARAVLEAHLCAGRTEGPLVEGWANLRRDLPLACAAAGVPVVTLTQLRGIAATWLLDEGVPKDAIVRLARWRDATMLDRYYGKRNSPAVKSAAERLAKPPPD